MKICFLADAESVHTHRWARQFAERGHTVFVLSLVFARIPGVTVRVIGSRHAKGLAAYPLALPGVRRALREFRPDVLHAHYAGGYGFVAAMSGYRPFVLTAWGSDVLIVPRRSRLLGRLVRKALCSADLVTSMSAHMTAVIREFGVPLNRLFTLPFGVDTTVFHPGQASRARFEASGPQLIVSTRHLKPIYNVRLLIEALPEVLKSAPAARVEVIGDGPEKGALEARAQELKIRSRVLFRGSVPQKEIAALLSRADVFVSTSLSDGNNISLNEAMACGAFPVVTDIPANREWIQHGSSGFLVSPTDPAMLAEYMIAALRNPCLRRDAAVENWKTIQQRGSWEASMLMMEERYRVLLRRNADLTEWRGPGLVS